MQEDAIIVKFDNEGNIILKKFLGCIGNDSFNSITKTSDGIVVAGGSELSSSIGCDWEGYTVKGLRDATIVKYYTVPNNNYIITASAGENGTIYPNGDISVEYGESQTFTFTPATCYEIDQVLVDGTNNPAAVAAGNYTFTNVTANHTISVTFKTKSYIITASAGANGTIDPSGNVTVNCGNNQTFTFTPANCYEIDQVLVDGTNNPAAVAAGSYTFENITADHTISVTFKIIDGIYENLSGSINVYPNPTTGELQVISYELQVISIEVYDIYERNVGANLCVRLDENKIDISDLASGIYFVKIYTNAGIVIKKVVKE